MSIKVMVNGLPGRMASKVAEHVLKHSDMELLPYSLTGPESESSDYSIANHKMELILPNNREKMLHEVLSYNPFIAVDFTLPSAVNENAEFYCKNKIPFVMGTTGGNRESLEETVKNSEICAVIAPNMAKQIVAFQAMMKYAAENFPGVFSEYNVEIIESHQKGKADTSGTAKSMIEYFNKLGVSVTKEDIVKIRDPEKQKEIGVPEEYLSGHGWHTYTLTSKDNTVLFRFTHNVNGREIYAAGTIDAIRYLHKRMLEGEKGRVYSMIDVLKS